jgi:hypothetical protein
MNKILLALVVLAMCAAPVFANPEQGLKEYYDHNFDDAITSCKGGKDIVSRMILGLSYLEKYNIYKNKLDKEQASMYLKVLAVDVTIDDAPTIAQFLEIKGNPNGNKEATKLLKKSFENAKTTPEHVLLMATFLDLDKGIDTCKEALSAISKRLKPVRDYVLKGGNMPKEMQNDLFTNPELIEPLIALLAEKKTASYARKCLVYIEEPTLQYLEELEMTKPISDAIVAVKIAMTSRLKKYPDSTWSSAAGD